MNNRIKRNITIPDYILEIIKLFKDKNQEIYLVGGSVRDSILGIESSDYDLCTSMSTNEIKSLFNEYNIINENGLKHGTVSIIYKGNKIEITEFRSLSDEKYDIYHDLYHRDFTINSLAYDGEYLYFNDTALFDLENKIIKSANPLVNLKEDPLRILRAIRFYSKYGYIIDIKTKEALFELKGLLLKVSIERIREEFNKILLGKYFYEAIDEYREILAVIIPEIEIMFNYNQNNIFHLNDLYQHTINVVKNTTNILEVRLAAFLHDIGKPNSRVVDDNNQAHYYLHAYEGEKISKDILERFKYSKKTIKIVLFLIKYHDYNLSEKNRNIKKLLFNIAKEFDIEDYKIIFDYLLNLKEADRMDHNYSNKDTKLLDLAIVRKIGYEIINDMKDNSCFNLKNLNINGYDLINLGYNGKEIGNTLNYLLEAVINDKVANEKDSLIKYLNKNKANS